MFDVICVMDSRFVGGTAAALAGDVRAFLDDGMRVGLVEVTSSYLKGASDRRSRVMKNCIADPRLDVFAASDVVELRTRVAFLHHPMTFFYGLHHPIRIFSDKSFIVAHHLPFRGDGSLQYDPIAVMRRAARDTGTRALWAPVSGLCRQQLEAFAPLIRLAGEDWPNAFDTSGWLPGREIFRNANLAIGRHGRADILKWPAQAPAIRASLPTLPNTEVYVMGCPSDAFRQMRVDISDWNVLNFDAEPVQAFLERLDVFIYHYHCHSSESFGRTVAEAMLMGCVCILDPRLEATFGDLALYCPPTDTAEVLSRLRANPAGARELAARARAAIQAQHDQAEIPLRFARFAADEGVTTVGTRRYASPLSVARKTIGMIRRGEYFETHLATKH